MLNRSDFLARQYPELRVAAWKATRAGPPAGDLPSLRQAARSEAHRNRFHAANMTAAFRDLGAKGRSPVEFQIEKAMAGDLNYSQRDVLIDYLLHAEVETGFLIGFHDRQGLDGDLRYGLARDAAAPSFKHISRKTVELRPDEPVLLSGDRVIASLRHGPDHDSRIKSSTSQIWAVLFASPGDGEDEVDAAVASVMDEGEARGIWTIERDG
jgi:DNA/RNA-binding domain of Phe-tRNA-synthetase-like protein